MQSWAATTLLKHGAMVLCIGRVASGEFYPVTVCDVLGLTAAPWTRRADHNRYDGVVRDTSVQSGRAGPPPRLPMRAVSARHVH